MLFITPSTDRKQAKDYFVRSLDREDYYVKDAAEIAGEWHGLGAEMLGLQGPIEKNDYFSLCGNINPMTGQSLTPHKRGDRRVLYDFTFDVPKSVSLAYELGGDERILESFKIAVSDTMSEMEGAMMARVRSNKRWQNRPSANMVWADFIHRTSRPVGGVPDPQLHCHAVVFNCTWDPEEELFKAAEYSNLVRDKGYYQAAFHSRLTERLENLGYGIERDGNSFRLLGIDPQTVDKFARRSEVIDAEAERLGITNSKSKGELGRKTRERKEEDGMSVPELRQTWKKRLTPDELDSIVEARRGQESTTLDATRAMDYALSHCFERASAITEKELLKTALIHSQGRAGVQDIREQLSRKEIITRQHNGISYVTTRAVLQEELSMTAFVRDGRGKYAKLGGGKPPALDPRLSKEQRDAALVILGSRDRVTALKGGAGTGKTTMMQATVKAIEASGRKVFTFAPSAEASRGVLRSEGFAGAETVERLLIDSKMQASVKGQVLWIDEAGLLSAKDMKRLFDMAGQQDCRVVLSGDTNQHSPVFRGDAMRILERDAGMKSGELKEIRRQKNETYREAVAAISDGDILGKDGRTRLQAGIEMLDGIGAIIESPGDTRHRQIADDYAEITAGRKAGGKPKTVLVVSPTHAEANKVTQAIREVLQGEGRVGADERSFTALRPLNLTEAQKQDILEYRSGSVVQFHQNAKGFRRGDKLTVTGVDKNAVHAKRMDGSAAIVPLLEAVKFQVYAPESVAFARGDRLRITQNGFSRETRRGAVGITKGDRLNNGAVYEVAGFTKQGDIRLSNGFVVPKDYGGISHGYVVTSHASQGKTVDVALIALGSDSLAAANREQFYVSVSRAREAVRIFTDDKAAMLDAVKESAARLSASELVRGMERKRKPSFTQRMLQAGVIQRVYKSLRERWAVPVTVRDRGEGLSLGI